MIMVRLISWSGCSAFGLATRECGEMLDTPGRRVCVLRSWPSRGRVVRSLYALRGTEWRVDDEFVWLCVETTATRIDHCPALESSRQSPGQRTQNRGSAGFRRFRGRFGLRLRRGRRFRFRLPSSVRQARARAADARWPCCRHKPEELDWALSPVRCGRGVARICACARTC